MIVPRAPDNRSVAFAFELSPEHYRPDVFLGIANADFPRGFPVPNRLVLRVHFSISFCCFLITLMNIPS